MASTFPTQTQPRRIGDLVLWEPHVGYTRVSAFIKNAGGSAVDLLDPLGYPVKSDGSGGYELAYSGDEASVIGLILFMNEIKLIATTGITTFKVPVLVRGTVLIDPANIVGTDAAGGTFNTTTIKSTLAAISPPIISLAEPAIQTTQSS